MTLSSLDSKNYISNNLDIEVLDTNIVSELPNEILFQIFSYLKESELLRLSSTCKKWRSVSEKLYFRQLDLPENAFRLAQLYTFQFNKSQKCFTERLDQYKKALPLITNLNITENLILKDFSFVEIKKSFFNLRKITFAESASELRKPFAIEDFINNIPSTVRELNLYHIDQMSSEQFKNFSIATTDLEIISLNYQAKIIEESNLITFFEKHPKLKVFKIQGWGKIGDKFFKSIADYSNLRVLKTNLEIDSGVMELKSQSLTHLSLNVKNLSAGRIMGLVKDLPAIEKCTLNNLDEVTSEHLNFFMDCKKLRKLKLFTSFRNTSRSRVKNCVKASKIGKHPSLKELNIDFVEFVHKNKKFVLKTYIDYVINTTKLSR